MSKQFQNTCSIFCKHRRYAAHSFDPAWMAVSPHGERRHVSTACLRLRAAAEMTQPLPAAAFCPVTGTAPAGRRPVGPLLRRSEHFAHEMLHGAGRGTTEAAASERPQFSCGVRLRWRRETCGPEHRGRPVHILKCRTLQGKAASRIRRFHQKFLCGLKPPPSGGKSG